MDGDQGDKPLLTKAAIMKVAAAFGSFALMLLIALANGENLECRLTPNKGFVNGEIPPNPTPAVR